ncbi:hypothetical protein CISG_04697 [Coccidioides immitis RMSCC 3703]|uniref:Uncharacterized protein n=2 Tax=Coccidioides immitis TaxID=5501 RepID=A0A0J8QRF5_COCIT|nr:hypothetical protein CIRG_09510 [Coccidioides immitis RMSCC 2394]KMU75279.1 hypothetical protein CISG_04697 [Coccidioides immitis RMSCC 3703]
MCVAGASRLPEPSHALPMTLRPQLTNPKIVAYGQYVKALRHSGAAGRTIAPSHLGVGRVEQGVFNGPDINLYGTKGRNQMETGQKCYLKREIRWNQRHADRFLSATTEAVACTFLVTMAFVWSGAMRQVWSVVALGGTIAILPEPFTRYT